MQVTIAKPIRTPGRVVLGPRMVGQHYARIVAVADGSGRMEVYDNLSRTWCLAADRCNFNELWSAAAVPLSLSARALTDFASD